MLKFACLLLLVVAAGAASTGQAVGARRFTRDENESIGRYIKALLNNLKEAMPNGIPELNIPPLDPLNIEELDAHFKQDIADIQLNLKQLHMAGLSSFVVREAEGDLNTMTFSLDIFVPEVAGSATYDLDGKVLIFPLYGKGDAMMKIDDLHIQGTASISIVDMKKIQLTNFHLGIVFSQFQMYLENIVGGGNLGNIVNTVLNMMGKLLYDKFKDKLLPIVNRIIKDAINSKLESINLQEIIGGADPPVTRFSVTPLQDSVNTYVDILMENLRGYLKENFEPLPVPEVSAGFRRKVLGITWHGGAKVTSGDIHSLSTIHRIGDFHLSNEGSKVSAGGTIGVNGLFGRISSELWFMSIRIRPGVEFRIDTVRVGARVVADLASETEIAQLEEFGITEVSKISVKITNLGVLGWALGPLANLVINAVKGKIIAAIENPIRQEIARLLSQLELPQFFIAN